MREEFKHHRLNEVGKAKNETIGEVFSTTLDTIEKIATPAAHPRFMALLKTKLEEACFAARRAVALQKENQA